MKKILLGALVSTIFTGSVLAEASCSAFNGFYLGGGLTYSNGKINNKVSIPGVSDTIDGSSSGVGVNAFLGYGIVFGDGFYFGGELGLGYDGSRFNNKSAGTGVFNGLRFKSSSSLTYNITARLGYVISQVLPYVKFGFEGRSAASLRTPSGNTIALVNGGTVEAKRHGIILGAGIDYALTKNIFIRGEYTHNFGSKSIYTYNINNIKILDFRTPTDTFLIGVGYKF